MRVVLQELAAVTAALGVSGAGYYFLCIWAARRFLAQTADHGATCHTPPVSILKSLKGVDPHMYAALHSHCVLDYPEYEVLFGVSDLSDPAVALVREIQQHYPQVHLRLVHCPLRLGHNGKVSNLAQMLPQASHEHVVISDSDILVSPDFLRRVMRHFGEMKVGMVTTLYRAVHGRGLWSKLEALGISTDFMGGVLAARELERGIRFALGASIATTKSVLAAMGGLEPLANYLGDDYELGARTAAAGYKVELADVVVETALPDYAFSEFWSHQLRWARNIKDRRRLQYFGLAVTFALPWGILAVIAVPHAWWTWAALAPAALARFGAAVVVGHKLLRDPMVLRDLWLVPVRDCIALVLWLVSFADNTVTWRGARFRVRDGKLTPLP